ncbi:hypothetical protein YT1_1307 [Rhodococcus ruber]|nr:hypothetical protein YT1_1307 [Rhodococcus ruber]
MPADVRVPPVRAHVSPFSDSPNETYRGSAARSGATTRETFGTSAGARSGPR